jgi:5-methylthioadenosine/S-adenosylhomocysteine deaminase
MIIEALTERKRHEIVYTRHYHEYDTYFFFEDESEGRLRYREDEFINKKGEITNVRGRLTLVGVSSRRNL